MPPESFDSKLARIMGHFQPSISATEVDRRFQLAAKERGWDRSGPEDIPQAEIDAVVRRMVDGATLIDPDGGRP